MVEGLTSPVKLEDLGPGIKGRKIPPEEMILKVEQVEKLAQHVGGIFGDWIKEFYAKYLPKTK